MECHSTLRKVYNFKWFFRTQWSLKMNEPSVQFRKLRKEQLKKQPKERKKKEWIKIKAEINEREKQKNKRLQQKS
jgi:predicted nucleotidyltransferase